MAESAARPSVRAAGPGCRISGDLISCSAPRCTAGTRSKPGRLITFSGRNFLPHHEPTMMSGARAMTSAAVTMRSLADLQAARSAKISLPPAASISSETQPMPEIIGSSHSSKYTFGRRGISAARSFARVTPSAKSCARRSARAAAPTKAPSVRIMARISATLR